MAHVHLVTKTLNASKGIGFNHSGRTFIFLPDGLGDISKLFMLTQRPKDWGELGMKLVSGALLYPMLNLMAFSLPRKQYPMSVAKYGRVRRPQGGSREPNETSPTQRLLCLKTRLKAWKNSQGQTANLWLY